MNNYILDDNGEPKVEPDILAWGRWMEECGQTGRVVKQDTLPNGAFVSTVFLGTDHAFNSGPPILWETMLFNCPAHSDYQERHASREAAIAGHERAVLAACERHREGDDEQASREDYEAWEDKFGQRNDAMPDTPTPARKTTRDFAEVLREKMAADPELAAAVAYESKIADQMAEAYEQGHWEAIAADRAARPGMEAFPKATPRPWKADRMLITAVNGREVTHTGLLGRRRASSEGHSGGDEDEANAALIAAAVNAFDSRDAAPADPTTRVVPVDLLQRAWTYIHGMVNLFDGTADEQKLSEEICGLLSTPLAETPHE